MARKKIWMMLLLIGAISNFYSCKGIIDYAYEYTYKYENTLNYELKIKSSIIGENLDTLIYEYIIPTQGSLTQIHYIEGTGNDSLLIFSNAITVTFNNERISSFTPKDNSKYNPLLGDNLEQTGISVYQSIGVYTFTDSDFENAIPIEE